MRKRLLLCAAMLAAALGLTAAPALAEINITGQWSGAWTCDGGPCQGKTGSMAARFKQAEDGTVTGTSILNGMTKTPLNCSLQKRQHHWGTFSRPFAMRPEQARYRRHCQGEHHQCQLR